MNTKETILAFIDAPGPDNFVQLIALSKLNPEATIHVVLTGRPVRFNATAEIEKWQWDLESSLMAQEASAARIKNFLRFFDMHVTRVFDGGIAPRTLVPHQVHFEEYYKFLDVDPLAAIRHSELETQELLARLVLDCPEKSISVAVGGPFTGLSQLMIRNPEVTNRFKEVHAMAATWGDVDLADFGDKPRGEMQFNIACDPQAAHMVLMGLECPVYLMPSEVTRVKEIGFPNAQALRRVLPTNKGANALYHLYALWYDGAVRPLQERNPEEQIYIYDLVSALSLDEELRSQIYEVVPVKISGVPYLTSDAQDWGKVIMKKTRRRKTGLQRFAATNLKEGGSDIYLDRLKAVLS